MNYLAVLCLLYSVSMPIKKGDLSNDGLYLLIKEKKCSTNEIKFKKKKYCLPEEPIISVDNFVAITDLMQAGKTQFFDVDLSRKATQKLNLTQTKLHRLKFALILNTKMTGWVELDSEPGVSQLRFYSTSFGPEIVEVHKYLESIMKTEKQ